VIYNKRYIRKQDTSDKDTYIKVQTRPDSGGWGVGGGGGVAAALLAFLGAGVGGEGKRKKKQTNLAGKW
jgi:hypothetical protein